MRTPWGWLPALAALLALSTPAAAADLNKVERTVAKEPAYKGKPKYCLLVFGPEAKTRVWLVLDDEVLYVDKNGNGDLTEEGERVKMPPFRESGYPHIQEEREARIDAIADGRLKHVGLSVRQRRVRPDFVAQTEAEKQLKELVKPGAEAMVYEMNLQVEARPLPGAKIDLAGRIGQSAGVDAEGYLQFAGRPQDAPVVRFGGPLQMALFARQTLLGGEKPEDLVAMIGTSGLGPGTFASVDYSGLFSDRAHPVAEVEFPGRGKLRAKVTLTGRC
jgi:hypothetical protein